MQSESFLSEITAIHFKSSHLHPRQYLLPKFFFYIFLLSFYNIGGLNGLIIWKEDKFGKKGGKRCGCTRWKRKRGRQMIELWREKSKESNMCELSKADLNQNTDRSLTIICCLSHMQFKLWITNTQKCVCQLLLWISSKPSRSREFLWLLSRRVKLSLSGFGEDRTSYLQSQEAISDRDAADCRLWLTASWGSVWLFFFPLEPTRTSEL